MPRIKTTLLQIAVLSCALTVALSLNYLYAWTGPTGTAPNNNVNLPINTGTATQVKDGNISVGAAANGSTTLGFIAYGAAATKGWQRIGGTAAPTQLLDLSGTAGVDGIKFPDGTTQVTGTRCVTSPELAVGWNSSATWNHGLGAQPTLLIPYLVNKVADKGYVPGDTFYLGAQTGDSTSAAGVSLLPGSTAVTIIWQNTGGTNLTEFIVNKTSPHSYSYILNTSWRLVLRACVI